MNEIKDIHKTFDELPEDEPTASLEAGTTLTGKYRLIEEIGRGGMGVVWAAEEMTAQRTVLRKVVLKFVPPDVKKFEEAVAQLRTSFQKIHELHHQHICPVLTLDEEPDIGYFHVMKWLGGETLDQYIGKTVGENQPLPLEEALRFLRPIAEALDYVHSKRIIHRDVKTSNIFVELDDTRTVQGIQLIDFGLASEIGGALSRGVTGTPSHMPPEQWKGRPQSGQTDQYALAVVAYKLLSGHLPFDIDDEAKLRLAVMQDSPEPIESMPKHVNAALLKALAKDAAKRFGNCVEFVQSISAVPAGTKPEKPIQEPVQTSPPLPVAPPSPPPLPPEVPATPITPEPPQPQPSPPTPRPVAPPPDDSKGTWSNGAKIGGVCIALLLLFGIVVAMWVSNPSPQPHQHESSAASEQNREPGTLQQQSIEQGRVITPERQLTPQERQRQLIQQTFQERARYEGFWQHGTFSGRVVFEFTAVDGSTISGVYFDPQWVSARRRFTVSLSPQMGEALFVGTLEPLGTISHPQGRATASQNELYSNNRNRISFDFDENNKLRAAIIGTTTIEVAGLERRD